MSYRDILVHVDERAEAATRQACAFGLAQREGATVTGLYVHPELRLPRHILHELGGSAERSQRLAREQVESHAAEAFRARAEAAGVPSQWRSGTGDVADVLALHARYADLLVVSQVGEAAEEDGSEEDENFDPELPDRVAMTAGPPVLVLPPGVAPSSSFGRVLVAWNASREASRAVRDAMPLLRRARTVTVLAALARGDRPTGEGEPGAEIARHLERHEVSVELLAPPAENRGAGELLLEHARRLEAELIVMGAYGRPRWREFILGGATRYLLDNATIPLLMSH